MHLFKGTVHEVFDPFLFGKKKLQLGLCKEARTILNFFFIFTHIFAKFVCQHSHQHSVGVVGDYLDMVVDLLTLFHRCG